MTRLDAIIDIRYGRTPVNSRFWAGAIGRALRPVAIASAVIGCEPAGGTVAPGEGIDPSLVLSSRGGATYPAAATTAVLGRGFDSLHGEVLGDCVKRTTPVSFAGSGAAPGATSNLVVHYARTREELASALGVSVEAAATFTFFSASVRAKYAQRDEITTDSSFLVISSEVVNDTETLESYQLSDGAERVLAESGPAAFHQMCGDQFIAARVTGGNLHIVVELTDEAKTSGTMNSIGGGADAWLFSVDGEVTSEARNALATFKKDVKVFQSGGLSHPRSDNLEALLEYAFSFREMISGPNAAHASPVAFVTRPYSVVPTRSKVTLLSLTQQRRKLTELANWHGEAKTRRRDLIEAQALAQGCGNASARFDAAVAQVEGVMASIEAEAQKCVDEPVRGCGNGRARPLERGQHLDLIRRCSASRGPSAEEKRAKARERDLEADLREARRGEPNGNPCKTWELRSIKPLVGNTAEWVSLTAAASPGGSMQAQEKRSLVEETGWAVMPALSVPTGVELQIEGKQPFSTGCGWFDGPCRRGDKAVSSWKLSLGPTVSGGVLKANGFEVRVQCSESTTSGRAATPRRTRPPTPSQRSLRPKLPPRPRP